MVRTAEKIIGCQLPPLEDVASTRYLSRAQNITRDRTHPGHGLFESWPSGRRYRSRPFLSESYTHLFTLNIIAH